MLALYQKQKDTETTSLRDLLALSPAIRFAGFSDMIDSEGNTRHILLLLSATNPAADEIERVNRWAKEKFGEVKVLWQSVPIETSVEE